MTTLPLFQQTATAKDILNDRMSLLGIVEDEINPDDVRFFQELKKQPIKPEFYVIDTSKASFKNDLPSMEHPLFALKAGDNEIRRYEHNGNTVKVSPNAMGAATIHDKDLWIYCISALLHAQNKGDTISKTVRFKAKNYLKATRKRTDGDGYRRMKESLDRLAGTRIITNIATGGRIVRKNFGLLDSVEIIYADPNDPASQMSEICVTLPEWLFNSIREKQVKTISAEYFSIRKPIDRRIYELCAKHCGNQKDWSVSLEILHKKTGSTANIREFRRAIKKLAETDDLPDYSISYIKDKGQEVVLCSSRKQ